MKDLLEIIVLLGYRIFIECASLVFLLVLCSLLLLFIDVIKDLGSIINYFFHKKD